MSVAGGLSTTTPNTLSSSTQPMGKAVIPKGVPCGSSALTTRVPPIFISLSSLDTSHPMLSKIGQLMSLAGVQSDD